MTFLVLQPARYLDESETVEFGEVHIFVGPDYVDHGPSRRESPTSARVRHRLEREPEMLAHGPMAVLWAICDDVVDQYLPVVAGVENDIDEIEDELFSGDPAVSKRIFGLQREVIDLQHATTPLVDMFERLQQIVMESTGATGGAGVPRRRRPRPPHRREGRRPSGDARQRAHRARHDRRARRTTRRCAGWPSSASQQNEQVKKVSGWAAILFAPTLVGTIYGMNFDTCPSCTGCSAIRWRSG